MVKTIELQVRKATKYDVVKNNALKIGVTYYVESLINPNTFCGPMVTADYTNVKEFSSWYKQKRVYVPVGALDNVIRLSKF